MDSIYKSKSKIKGKKMVRKRTNNDVNLYDNSMNNTMNNIYSNQYRTHEFDEMKTEENGEKSIVIGENFRPNELLLSTTNFTPNINNNQTTKLTRMTENSYTECNEPTSQYKRKMILDMANSVISESNTLFKNQYEQEYRPYEEQTEFQASIAQNKRTICFANNIINKYVMNKI